MPMLDIELNDATAEALLDLAGRKDRTLTETLTRAVSVYKFIEDNVVDTGDELALVDAHGNREVLQVL